MNERQPQNPWYLNKLVGLEVGPTGAQFGLDPQDTDFAHAFSGQSIVEQCMAVKAEYLVIWAKDNELAYYNSQLVPKALGLGERDILLETTKAAKGVSLPVIAYCQLQYPTYLLRTHPQFLMHSIDGQQILGRVCFNSGYLYHIKQVVDEIGQYEVQGFHFDMMDQGFGPPYGCWCDKCQALFEAEYGHPMPRQIDWDTGWEKMMEFRYNTSANFERQLSQHIKSNWPGLSLDFNYHGGPPCAWEVGQRPVQHAHIGDFVTGECGTWAFGPLQTSLNALFLAATKPGAVYQMVMQTGARMYHDTTVRPLVDLRWEALTLLAHGAQLTIVDKTAYDGQLNPVTYERIGKVFTEAQEKRPHFGQSPWQEVGVYYSSTSRDWHGRESPDKYQRSFVGAHRALTYSHIPMGVLLDENISPRKLENFPVIYLPNTAVLSAQEIEMLKEYVANGGLLLATGLTGLYTRPGQPASLSNIEDLVGGKFISSLPDLDNHISLPALNDDLSPISAEIPSDWPFLVYGPASVFELTTAQGYGHLYRPHRTLKQRMGEGNFSLPMSSDEVIGPAMLINNYGKGKVVYLPCSPDAALASEYRTVEPRLLLRNLIRYLRPNPEIDIAAPSYVESVVTHDPSDLVWRIHLVGYVSPPACTGPGRPHANFVLPSLIEDLPMYQVRINFNRPILGVQTLNSDTEIRWSDNEIILTVKDIHETVMVKINN